MNEICGIQGLPPSSPGFVAYIHGFSLALSMPVSSSTIRYWQPLGEYAQVLWEIFQIRDCYMEKES